MSKKNRKITISMDIEIPEEIVQEKLGEMIQENLDPLKEKLDIEVLKKHLGEDIANVRISSLHADIDADEILGLRHEPGGGYSGKIWEKATC